MHRNHITEVEGQRKTFVASIYLLTKSKQHERLGEQQTSPIMTKGSPIQLNSCHWSTRQGQFHQLRLWRGYNGEQSTTDPQTRTNRQTGSKGATQSKPKYCHSLKSGFILKHRAFYMYKQLSGFRKIILSCRIVSESYVLGESDISMAQNFPWLLSAHDKMHWNPVDAKSVQHHTRFQWVS